MRLDEEVEVAPLVAVEEDRGDRALGVAWVLWEWVGCGRELLANEFDQSFAGEFVLDLDGEGELFAVWLEHVVGADAVLVKRRLQLG